MTPREEQLVRNLSARLLLAQEDLRRGEAEWKASEARLQRKISYLERDKERALDRARKAEEKARYWHGLALRLSPTLRREKRVAA